MASPYSHLPDRSYWRRGVRDQEPGFIRDLYRKRFAIDQTTAVATAGSCFAQHIGRSLRDNDDTVIDAEPGPPGLSREERQAFGYGLFSARYGNVYTARQMLQLAQEALGERSPTDVLWRRNGRYHDALRPSVEPEGLGTAEEVLAHRADHLARVRDVLTRAEVFVFTLGLTEAWVHRRDGTVYPTAPETIAGEFDPATYDFHNFTASDVAGDLRGLRDLLRAANPSIRLLFTVSPVPLAATASTQHVLPATVYSKSVLRAAAGELYAEHQDVDYFPSYEIVSSPFLRMPFFDSDLRSVTNQGVECVMRHFFAEHAPSAVAPSEWRTVQPAMTAEDVVCEDALLEAFGT